MNAATEASALETRFSERKPSEFPAATDAGYQARYLQAAAYLKKNVHSEVLAGSILSEFKKGNAPLYLTDHGPAHIDKVIVRASNIITQGAIALTAYEEYLLLLAIHFHDVGNYYGREKHEVASGQVMQHLGPLAGEDAPEKRTILQIAAAHGGSTSGDKDKIFRLQENTDLLGHKVRMRLLAAILRFADELADDRTRAARFSISTGTIPAESELYHAYAMSLTSVVVDDNEVRLKYEFDRTTALRTFKKNTHDVFLLDEIFSRLVKMHCERMYCMRFINPGPCIQRISAEVCIYSSFSASDFLEEPLKTYGVALQETGYPCNGGGSIGALCPQLAGVSGQGVSAELAKVEGATDHE